MTLLLQGAGRQQAVSGVVAPLFVSAEVGTVNASTVAVTFDQDVSASDYSAGVTIKVNGSGATISSATRQANHAIVYYVLSAAVVFGDAVTWEYVKASGNIVAEDDNTPLDNVTAQSVTNNTVDTIGNGLRTAAVAYYKMDEASGTRIDATGRGNDLTPSGSPAGVAGKVSNAVRFVRTNPDYLKSSRSNTDLALTATYYISMWLKIPDTSHDYFLMSRITDDQQETTQYAIIFDVASQQIFFNDWNVTVLSPVISQGVWYFLECYRDTDNLLTGISLNSGGFTTFETFSSAAPDVEAPTFFGAFLPETDLNSAADALIDEVFIMKRLPSQDERDYLYNSGAGRALFPAP